MNIKRVGTVLIFSALLFSTLQILQAEDEPARKDINFSTELLALIRAEMLEIAGGIQTISLSIAVADWDTIQKTSIKLRDSYIMDQNLSTQQAQELKEILPENFKLLDAEFHQRADKLGIAAQNKDPEMVAFHYSRLVENCIHCHSAYARTRFPGFDISVAQEHIH